MKILYTVLKNIEREYVTVPPEQGGFLGIKDGIVTAYCHDSITVVENKAIYYPNQSLLENVIREWENQGVAFAGILHSHMSGEEALSHDDLEFIDVMMRMNPQFDSLLFPVVIPMEMLVCYRAYYTKGQVMINEESIQVIDNNWEVFSLKTKVKNMVVLPPKGLCGHNCADGCIYWNPYKKDSNGRQYCNWYSSYYYPHERQGCLSFKR